MGRIYRYRWHGRALKLFRLRRHMTQMELAERAELYQASLSRFELGQGRAPTLIELAQLADALNIGHGALFAQCIRRLPEAQQPPPRGRHAVRRP